MSVDQEIAAIQQDPSTRDWLREALMASLRHDPVDVSHDAQRLADLLTRRADSLLGVEASPPAPAQPAIAAIAYAFKAEEGLAFLDAWLHGDFDLIREQWPEAPDAAFQVGSSTPTVATNPR